MRIKAVIFDFANTLFNYEDFMSKSWAIEFQILRERGLKMPADEYQRIRAKVLSSPNVGWRTERYWTTILASLSEMVEQDPLGILREFDRRSKGLIMSTAKPYPETLNVVKKVKVMGLKIGILANLTRWEGKLLDRFRLTPHFDSVVISEEVGVKKPDLQAFWLVLNNLSCQPEESVMIGDRYDTDIAPAKQIGMKTIRVKRGWFIHQRIVDESMRPDYEVANLVEALKIVEGLVG
jgi:HAD superfamily hydrolase (TIGR01662 family)